MYHEIVTTLRTTRIRLGISQKQLAMEIGVDTSMISKYEVGKIPIKTGVLCNWVRALGLKLTVER